MPIAKKYFSISPNNDKPTIALAANQIRAGFSSKQGDPVIRFSVPAANMLLDVNSLKLVGQIQVKTANDNNVLQDKTNIDDNNGANLSRVTSANIPNYGGVHNVIDKIVIQSKKSNVELTSVNNYSMNASLMEAYSHNNDDYVFGDVETQSMAQGLNAIHSNRKMNLSANNTTMALNNATDKNIGQHFGIKLEVDMLKAGNLHLGQDFLGGLLVNIHLAPDSAFFCNRFREVAANQTSAALDNVMYVLRNLKLEGNYLIPNQDDLNEYQAVKVLNGKLNNLNDVHSDDNSIQYTPQLNAVKGMINLFLDDDQQNNLLLQQNNFKNPLGLKEVEQSKDNLRYPLSYPVKVVPNVDSTSNSGLQLNNLADVNGIPNKEDLVGDAEVRLQFERALLGGDAKKSVNNLGELRRSITADYQALGGNANNAAGTNLHPLMNGVGADYSYGMNMSVNYVNRDYGAQIKSGVASGLDKYPAMSNTKSETVQTYIRHIATLDTNSLQRNQ